MTSQDAVGRLRNGLAEVRPQSISRVTRDELAGRCRVIAEVLDRYHELTDPMLTGNGSGSTGVLLMPVTYTATVRELERLLGVMREDRSRALVRLEDGSKASVRQLRWHVMAWHVDAVRVVRAVPKTSRKRGRLVRLLNEDGSAATLPMLRVLRVPGASERLASAGVRWLAGEWGLGSEPMLWVDPAERRSA